MSLDNFSRRCESVSRLSQVLARTCPLEPPRPSAPEGEIPTTRRTQHGLDVGAAAYLFTPGSSLMKTSVLALLAAAFALGPSCATATTMLGEGVSSDVNAVPPVTQSYSTYTAADLATPHTVSSSVVAYGSSSNGSITGMAGSFNMLAYSHADNPFTNGCTTCGTLVSQQHDNGGFTDAIHLTSATLAVGTPVDLHVTMNIASSVTSSQAQSLYLDSSYVVQFMVSNFANSVSLFDDGPGYGTEVHSGVLHTFVGQTIDLTSSFAFFTYAEYLDQTVRTIQANLESSFYVDSLDPAVTVAADSMHDYATPVSAVPEPSPVMLLLAGLVAVGGLSSFRRNAANGK